MLKLQVKRDPHPREVESAVAVGGWWLQFQCVDGIGLLIDNIHVHANSVDDTVVVELGFELDSAEASCNAMLAEIARQRESKVQGKPTC